MPLARRVPKRGFSNARFRIDYIPVNVAALQQFEDGSRVDEVVLRKKGVVRGNAFGVKVLGGGLLIRRLTVVAAAFSDSARAKIEGAGGTCEVARQRQFGP